MSFSLSRSAFLFCEENIERIFFTHFSSREPGLPWMRFAVLSSPIEFIL